ncbi:MAG: threonine dehydratase [Candidatus Levybacteria bacterium RIFCSPHIGHO2_12_FULL_38_12]|nr:MAG: threonine dehydratase [Candidatus Levybacteria bacterium RIFCSPHIGHO2_01_FULL_38_12]OGH22803.1 MAG: threonine dehydratase [Candidatus Levybacteria bacterium RIFCSPHIGHO2_12_FULL_38_12]OGH33976.1 MAG: threonine dehydratase [Candidatus Levybacteria bacterium RIFCSPLOWO2_01_FULL_37_20]OGH44812.1 MAG: threonine dehydratase [Candidatus Levybacteria bacterium RIFCSPLOWO2_02_FULL_37_18]
MKKFNFPFTVKDIDEAAARINGIAKNTPLIKSKILSGQFGADIYVKREDLQKIRSYKIRGSYNLMRSLSDKERAKGVICASAGNHAQGVAFNASMLEINATICMPVKTTLQKIQRVKQFGGKWVEIKLIGKTFDEAYKAAEKQSKQTGAIFVSAFDDYRVIAGQGTIAKELVEELGDTIDYVLCPIGGGGLISGIGVYLKSMLPKVKLIGVEPLGAASMDKSFKEGKVTPLEQIDNFVDGAAVGTVGQKTFAIAKEVVDEILVVPEGKVCTIMIDLYQNEGVIAEPAGALSISALDLIKHRIKGKTVVCILSGGNNDILRYPEILERSLVYLGRKHYFLVEFPQKPGQLRQFVDKALGPTDDIVRFEYIKKSSKETGPALIGIEQENKEDFNSLIKRMDKLQISYKVLKPSDPFYSYLL